MKCAVAYFLDNSPDFWAMARNSAASILRHSPKPPDIYFVCTFRPYPTAEIERTQAEFRSRIRVIEVAETIGKWGFNIGHWHFKNVNATRLLTPMIEELAGYDAVLALDADTECRGDIAKFFAIPNNGCDLVAVADLGFPLDWSRADMTRNIRNMPFDIETTKRIGEIVGEKWKDAAANFPYVNGGAVIYRIDNIRQHPLEYQQRLALARELLEKHKWTFFEQDVLNLVMSIRRLPTTEYNYIPPESGTDDSIAIIVHCIGGREARRADLLKRSRERDTAFTKPKDKNANMKKPKITVYAITKNEQKFVDRWMDSMGEADAIAVLDTGSTDNTVASLWARGAEVMVQKYETWGKPSEYHDIMARGGLPWRFDWARNDSIDFALKVAPDTDILVCTDLDEILLPGWRAKLENAYIEAVSKTGKVPTTFTYEYVWNFNADGTDGTKFTYEKFHTPESGARWSHPVHEILDYPNGKSAWHIPGIRLEHHADPEKSRSQYLNLLALSVEEAPMDDRNAHYYARELMFRGRWEEAIVGFKKHLRLPTARWNAERAASMRFIAKCLHQLKRDSEVPAWLMMAMMEAPEQREAALELAEYLHTTISTQPENERDWWALKAACERCLAVKNRSMSYLTRPEAWGARPHDLYSVALWYCGERQRAIEENQIAMRLDPNDKRLVANDEVMRRACQAG